MSKRKKRKLPKRRSAVALGAILRGNKKMRDRRKRRQKEKDAKLNNGGEE